MKHVRQDVVKRLGVAGHLQRDVEAFLHPELLHRVSHFFGPHIQCKIGAHLAREIQAIRIHIGDNDVTRAGAFTNRNGHATDRPGAGHENVFADQIK